VAKLEVSTKEAEATKEIVEKEAAEA